MSVGAGIEMGPIRINEKKTLWWRWWIIEFHFLVACFQFLPILLSRLLLTHCLVIGDMFSEILLNGYNYVVQVTWSTYIDKHSRLNINDLGEAREGEAVEEEQASSYRLKIRVHNDLQRANRRLQIHTGKAVDLKSDITKQTK